MERCPWKLHSVEWHLRDNDTGTYKLKIYICISISIVMSFNILYFVLAKIPLANISQILATLIINIEIYIYIYIYIFISMQIQYFNIFVNIHRNDLFYSL